MSGVSPTIPSTPKTPIRAITSKLSTKSSPSIASADQSYEPLLKGLFAHRLKFVFLRSALVVWVVSVTWACWQSNSDGLMGSIGIPLKPWTLIYSGLTWFALAVPAIVLRKVFLTDTRSPAASPHNIVSIALSKNSTRVAFLTYLASAFCILLIHKAMSATYESADAKLTVFVKSKKHPHYLNGRLVFLALTQVVTAVAFSLRGAMLDRFVYRWPLSVNQKGSALYLSVLLSSVVSSVFTTMSLVASMATFAAMRTVLPILFKFPILPLFLRPFTAHFVKGSWSFLLPFFHLSLLFRAWLLAFTTFFVWDLADSLFDTVVAEAVPISLLGKEPNATLVSGITSKSAIFKYFAYSEIRELAMDDSPSGSARRTDLFGDQKSVPNLWTFLARESLALLDKDYQHLLRRGAPPPPPPAAPVKAPATPGPMIGTPTPLLRTQIFKAHKESPRDAALDALASDGPITQAVEAAADATHVPEIFRSVESKVLATPIVEETTKNVVQVASLGSRLREQVSGFGNTMWDMHAPGVLKESLQQLVQWWYHERRSKIVEKALPFRELDVVVVEALSHLICASLAEDRYGTVQRDIPKILEVMVSYLTAVEEYQIEVNNLLKPLPETPLPPKEQEEYDILAIEIHKSQEILGFVADGLKEGLARITRTFGTKLLAFKFPPRIANKLQGFLDYAS
ncbi:nucleoporin protein Ndc1-Nup [Panaeolus papilionaceus]|nr:nucleoporin protein Ndc1-Nup [Panaeolus papilionaceus]